MATEDTVNGIPAESLGCLFVFLALGVGLIFRQLYKAFKVPYTPALVTFGIVIGVIPIHLGFIGKILILSCNLDPNGVLMIFLPTLIFESAINMDWYAVKKSLLNILLLAGPGVFISSMLIGVSVKVIVRYDDDDFTWIAAFTLASIMSATDPVAVIALLKTIGSPVNFNVLVEGEALINDGFAMVFFILFSSLLKGEETSAGGIITKFIALAGGSPLLGIAFGTAGCFCLRYISRDSIMITTLTFCVSYLCFYTAEFTTLQLSGILSTTTLGIFMSVFGKTGIDFRAQDLMYAIWAFVQYACETLFFLLAGINIGYNIFFCADTTIGIGDWFRMIGLYACIQLVRFIVIIIFCPCLSRIGYHLNWKETVVLWYGGLRGALSIALALLLRNEDSIPLRTRQLIIFHTVGMSTLTMLINAPTCHLLIKAVKMLKVPAAKIKIKNNFLAEMQDEIKNKFEELRSLKYNELCDWEQIKVFVGLRDADSVQLINNSEGVLPTIDTNLLAETRYRTLKTIKKMFWERYEEGQLSKSAITLLMDSCDQGLDLSSQPIWIWPHLYSNFIHLRARRIMQKIISWPFIGRLAKNYIAESLSLLYQVSTTFITVLENLIHLQQNYAGSLSEPRHIANELKKNILEANNYLISIQDEFTDIIKTVQLQRTAANILHFCLNFADKAARDGKIDENEAKEIQRHLDKKMSKIPKLKAHDHVPLFDQFILQFPAFSSLKRAQIVEMKQLAENKSFEKGEKLFSKGEAVSAFYILTKGSVKEISESAGYENALLKGVGTLLDLMTVLDESHRPSYTCIATCKVVTKKLPMEFMERVLKENQDFEKFCYKIILPAVVKSPDANCKELSIFDELTLFEYIQDAKLITVEAGAQVYLNFGGVLFKGSLLQRKDSSPESQKIYNPVSYIPKTDEPFTVVHRAKILGFNRAQNLNLNNAQNLSLNNVRIFSN